MYPYNIKTTDTKPKKNIVMANDVEIISEMLIDAINDEASDYKKYTTLASIINNSEDSETVKSMSYDEYKHKRLFEEIYNNLTGMKAPEAKEEADIVYDNLTDALKDSLFGELEAVEMYREIMAAVEDQYIRDMLYEIITDEQAHADLINYLLAKNSEEIK